MRLHADESASAVAVMTEIATILWRRRLLQALRERAMPLHTSETWDAVGRKPGCLCTWEEGDSPCPVHGEDEEAQP